MIVRLFYICSIFAAFVCGQVTFIRLRPVTFLPVSFGLAQECRLSSATGGSAVSAGECKPLPECLLVYTQLIELQRRPCRLQNGLFGVCCPTDSANVTSGLSTAGTLVFRPPSNVVIPDLKLRDFQNAFQSAREAVRRRTQLESQLFQDRVVVRPGTPVGLHLELFPTTQQTLDIGAGALSNLETSIQLVNQYTFILVLIQFICTEVRGRLIFITGLDWNWQIRFKSDLLMSLKKQKQCPQMNLRRKRHLYANELVMSA